MLRCLFDDPYSCDLPRLFLSRLRPKFLFYMFVSPLLCFIRKMVMKYFKEEVMVEDRWVTDVCIRKVCRSWHSFSTTSIFNVSRTTQHEVKAYFLLDSVRRCSRLTLIMWRISKISTTRLFFSPRLLARVCLMSNLMHPQNVCIGFQNSNIKIISWPGPGLMSMFLIICLKRRLIWKRNYCLPRKT